MEHNLQKIIQDHFHDVMAYIHEKVMVPTNADAFEMKGEFKNLAGDINLEYTVVIKDLNPPREAKPIPKEK